MSHLHQIIQEIAQKDAQFFVSIATEAVLTKGERRQLRLAIKSERNAVSLLKNPMCSADVKHMIVKAYCPL